MDTQLADLLAQRTRLARQVALWKLLQGQPIRHPPRELEVRCNYASHLRTAGWPKPALDHLMDALLSTSRRIQSGIRIAIQGGRGSWSEESLAQAIPDAQVLRLSTVAAAWKAVTEGRAAAAWLAASNSTTGDIALTQGPRSEGTVWLERAHPIQHALLARPGARLDGLRRVAGHPQALAQCARTLKQLAPRARPVPSVDGAHTARRLAGMETGVLCSANLAPRLGLKVLAPSVVDDSANETTFQLLVAPV